MKLPPWVKSEKQTLDFLTKEIEQLQRVVGFLEHNLESKSKEAHYWKEEARYWKDLAPKPEDEKE